MNTTIKLFIDTTNEYVESKQHSLTDVYTVLSSESVQSAINLLKDFSFEVDTREPTLFEYITNLIIIPSDLWREIGQTDNEVFDTYKRLFNYDVPIRNHSEAESAYDERLRHVRENVNIRKLLGNIDNDFIEAVDDIAQYLDKFNKSVSINSIFFRKNFLKLKVFYRQLSYEYIHQQKGYDIFGLICDIGGSMVLFIG